MKHIQSPHWERNPLKIKSNPVVSLPPGYLDKINDKKPPAKEISQKEAGQLFSRIARKICPEKWDKFGFEFTRNTKSVANFCMKQVSQKNNRGIFLLGKPGSGKSTMFKILRLWIMQFSDLESQRFNIVSTQDMVSAYEKDGDEGLKKYMSGNWLFDDIDTEENAVHYGKKEDILRRILERRYAKMDEQQIITHLCTNLTKEQFVERYGQRVGSRMNEMFDLAILSEKDYRHVNRDKRLNATKYNN
ncbi:hypothetical protein [Owenweeksia hongkongensis]|nr:hypothetical protein [Owenweeksia hongkongensis]